MNYLIIGGTGTLGVELIRQLGDRDSITCLSRCELKQKELKAKFPHVKCVLGDIRDPETLAQHMRGANVVFHVAALKHIDILEENPEESVRTNILGTMNVARLGLQYGCRVIFSSTDKAQFPVNVYGMSKGVSEKIMLHSGHAVYRWGNVVGSRGSALHYFIQTIRDSGTVNVTHPEMTRFWIRIEDAVGFMLATYKEAGGKLMIPPMKASRIVDLIGVIGKQLGCPSYNMKTTGLRPGEKIHEAISDSMSSDIADRFTEEELSDLVRPFL